MYLELSWAIFKKKLIIFTGVRDYIHVMDLASGHVAALDMLSSNHVGLKVMQDKTKRYNDFEKKGSLTTAQWH